MNSAKVKDQLQFFFFKTAVAGIGFGVWFGVFSMANVPVVGAIIGGLTATVLLIVMNLKRTQCDNVNTPHVAKYAAGKRSPGRFTPLNGPRFNGSRAGSNPLQKSERPNCRNTNNYGSPF